MIREALARVGERATGTGMPGWPDWQIGRPLELSPEVLVHPQAFALVPDVYACVSLIQATIAALPLRFYTGETEIERTGVKAATVADLFADANENQTGYELMEQVVGSMEISGNAYLLSEYADEDTPQELWCLPGHKTRPIPGPKRSIAAYEFDNGSNQPETIDAELIVHFPHYTPEHGGVGMSPLSVAALTYVTQRDMARWQSTFYKRGGMVGGSYRASEAVGAGELTRLQTEMEARMTGIDAAMRPFLMPRGLEYVRSGLSHDEMEFIASAKLTSQDIYKIFKIPPVLMGMKEGGGLSDAGATTDQDLFWENCIKPRTRRIEAIINEKFLASGLFGPGVTCMFDFSGVMPLQLQFLNRAKAYNEATGGPVLARAEARDDLGLDDMNDPRLKELLEPMTMMVVSEAAEANDPANQPDEVDPNVVVNPDEEQLQAATFAIDPRRDAMRLRASSNLRPLERQGHGLVLRLIDRQRVRAKERFESQRSVRVVDVEDLLEDRPEDAALLRRLIRYAVRQGGQQALANAGLDVAFSLQDDEVADFIRHRPDKGLRLINRTTRIRLRDSLARGVTAGESNDQLSRRIDRTFLKRRGDAERIARTEVVSAYNFATSRAYANEGVEKMMWLTARDHLVRHEHRAVDGQVVDVGQAFLVGGEFLRFPGDPNGSPGNIIHCRCTLVPVVDDAMRKFARVKRRTRGLWLDRILAQPTEGATP